MLKKIKLMQNVQTHSNLAYEYIYMNLKSLLTSLLIQQFFRLTTRKSITVPYYCTKGQ